MGRNISKALKGNKRSEETKEKISKSQKGQNNSNWKGGVTPLNKRIKDSIEYKLWREAVYARDNYTCQKCNDRGGKLHPHHIFNFATYLDLRLAIDNGITLCKKCHIEFHKKFGYMNNTREQLEEFLQ